MKVLIDTGIILDVLCSRQAFLDVSEKVFKLCEVKKITGYISALSLSRTHIAPAMPHLRTQYPFCTFISYCKDNAIL